MLSSTVSSVYALALLGKRFFNKFNLVPRWKGHKFPIPQYWRGKDHALRVEDFSTLVRWLRNEDYVQGLCVKTDGLVVVDLDPASLDSSLEDTMRFLLALAPTDFIVKTASGGAHLYYTQQAGKPVSNAGGVRNGIDIRADGGQVLFVGCAVTYEGDTAIKKGVPDGYVGVYEFIRDGELGVATDALYSFLSLRVRAENYQETEEGNKRALLHKQQPKSAQERVVLEALGAILTAWDGDVYDWLRLWMSAHEGSSGSIAVRDYLLTHPNVTWTDGELGKQKFIAAWANHIPNGYTVATLFWWARQTNWLSYTGYELPKDRVKQIDTRFIHVPETPPRRLVLQSQTGSGKTQAIRTLWDKLGKPKTVVFVPTVKLAMELHATLKRKDMPSVLYIDANLQTKDALELMQAHVLVTTLQTFATKVHPDMSQYGLVYIEESDQLLASFGRGGGGLYASHVREHEARAGFEVLDDALQNAHTVWAVDATMSQLTLAVFDNLSSLPVSVWMNVYQHEKAAVRVLADRETAIAKVLVGLMAGKRVVCACDTASQAQEVYETMKRFGYTNSLLITRETERDERVAEFMSDVDAGAEKYQLVCYNSVMASGVSITKVTPDVLVQIAGYLTPRANLQILNRYRSQKEVYLYYRTGENLYARKAEAVINDAETKAQLEAGFVGLNLTPRTKRAELRALIGAISVADAELQNRSPRAFYLNLLRDDGRQIVEDAEVISNDVIKHTLKDVREAKKSRKDFIRQNWRSVPPIDNERPALATYTDIEVALGQTHAWIERVFGGQVPDDADDDYLYEVAETFSSKLAALTVFATGDISKSASWVTDETKSVLTINNTVTIAKMLSKLTKHWDLTKPLTSDTLESVAPEFVAEVIAHRQIYEASVRNRQALESVVTGDTVKDAVALSKILLSLVGLKQRSVRGDYVVSNYSDALYLLRKRGVETFGVDIKPVSDEAYRKLTRHDRERVKELLDSGLTFSQAVDTVAEGAW